MHGVVGDVVVVVCVFLRVGVVCLYHVYSL